MFEFFLESIGSSHIWILFRYTQWTIQNVKFLCAMGSFGLFQTFCLQLSRCKRWFCSCDCALQRILYTCVFSYLFFFIISASQSGKSSTFGTSPFYNIKDFSVLYSSIRILSFFAISFFISVKTFPIRTKQSEITQRILFTLTPFNTHM